MQNELSNKMVKAASMYFDHHSVNNPLDFSPKRIPIEMASDQRWKERDGKELAWFIGHIGYMANDLFGTVDSYARALFINADHKEMEKLKYAVSSFFTLWEILPHKTELFLRSGNQNANLQNRFYTEIDRRYGSLLTKILENKNGRIILPENVNFITWNYDLQLERVYRGIVDASMSWNRLHDELPFNHVQGDPMQNKICHLNGFHGFRSAGNNDGQVELMDMLERNLLSEDYTLKNILDALGGIWKSIDRSHVTFQNHIKYAWEHDKNDDSNVVARAKKILKMTDVIVIIGYSFPFFNEDIDQFLLGGIGHDPYNREQVIIRNIKPDQEKVVRLLTTYEEEGIPDPIVNFVLDPEAEDYVASDLV
jgi:hypothetical protein